MLIFKYTVLINPLLRPIAFHEPQQPLQHLNAQRFGILGRLEQAGRTLGRRLIAYLSAALRKRNLSSKSIRSFSFNFL
jgi:hypothetical protein